MNTYNKKVNQMALEKILLLDVNEKIEKEANSKEQPWKS